MAAVELLIAHAVWLRRSDFVDRFVDTAGDLAGGRVLAWVRWRAATRALDAGRLPRSGSEAQVLRIAASLAEGVGVDLGEVVTGLDEANIGDAGIVGGFAGCVRGGCRAFGARAAGTGCTAATVQGGLPCSLCS